MEPLSLAERGQELRRKVHARKEAGGNKFTLVEVDLLDEIFRGNVPVGGNQFPPETVNEMLYTMKAQRDKLLWRLSSICDMAADDLRRGGMADGTCLHQIEADARATLDAVRAEINPPVATYIGTAQPLTCANCGQQSTTQGQFLGDGRWVCTESCRKELAEKPSYDDLATSGGIVDAT